MSEVSAGGGTPVASAIEPDGATNRLLTPEAMVRQIKRYVATIRRCLPGVSDPENVVADVLLSFWERRLWPVPEPYVWAAVMYAAVSALRRRATEARKYQRLGVEFDEGHRMLRPQSERRSA